MGLQGTVWTASEWEVAVEGSSANEPAVMHIRHRIAVPC
jgi:hypothetical protein